MTVNRHVCAKSICLLLVLWCVICLLFSKKRNPELISTEAKTKYVLYWTPLFNQPDYYMGFGYEPFKRCQFKNCYTTDDRTLVPLEKFDAIIFHSAIYDEFKHKKPWIRSPHQRYIFFEQEAPVHVKSDIRKWNFFFNWTMTFRFDSDIVGRYGYVRTRRGNYKLPSEEFVENKTQLAAWFVSHCYTPSKREYLVEEITKFMNVDIYGSCSNLTCEKTSSNECYNMVERDYKFYFSFENAFCKDYTTEKLYNILKRNVVPVVYGYGDYNLTAPPNSVINIADFDSVEQLVNYLKVVAMDSKKYLKFFEWKQSYEIDSSNFAGVCQLCQKLNEVYPISIYDDLYKWWRGKNDSFCRVEKDLPKIVRNLKMG